MRPPWLESPRRPHGLRRRDAGPVSCWRCGPAVPPPAESASTYCGPGALARRDEGGGGTTCTGVHQPRLPPRLCYTTSTPSHNTAPRITLHYTLLPQASTNPDYHCTTLRPLITLHPRKTLHPPTTGVHQPRLPPLARGLHRAVVGGGASLALGLGLGGGAA